MIFKVGDTVVYPHHGAALVEAIETRTIKGEQKEYLVLKVAQGDLTVRVPADNAEYVGVRDVVGQEGLDKVFQVLRAPHTEEPTNWSRRYKANLEKLASGDVNKVAEVSEMVAPTPVASVRLNVSLGSTAVSPLTLTVTVWVSTPGAKVIRVPAGMAM